MAIAKILYKSFYWKVWQFFSSFLLNIIFVRTFQSVVSAEFYSLVYLLSLAISFFSFGMDIGLNYYLSKKRLRPATAHFIILVATALALAVCLPLMSLFFQPSRFPGISLQKLLLFSSFQIAGGLLATLSGALFTANHQNFIPARIGSIFNGIVIAVSVVLNLSYAREEVIQCLFAVYFLFAFLQGLFLFVFSWRLYSVRRQDPRNSQDALNSATMALPAPATWVRLEEVIRFSFMAFIANFIFFTASRLSLYLMPYSMSLPDQGNYIQAYKIVEYAGLASSFIYYPFVAMVAGQDRVKMGEIVVFLVRLSNSFALLFSMFILASGWWLFPFLFGNSFDRIYSVFIRFIPGLFAVCSSTFFTAYYFGGGSTRINLISACILFASMGGLYFPLVKWGGPNGAALAFSAATLLSLLYDIILFRRSFDLRIGDVLLLRKADIRKIAFFVRQQEK